MSEKNENPCYGSGQHSHEVPELEGRVVLMRDGNHEGTEIYRVEGGFRFVSLDVGDVQTAPRCVLVRLVGVEIESLPEPYGCDLESPDGLALVGLSKDDDTLGLGIVLWDSQVSMTAWNLYRYPTADEIAAGRDEHAMFQVGYAATAAEGCERLREYGGGQLQLGLDGKVINVEAG